MLQFRLFGYPIKIEWFFLLLCLFLGMGYLDSGGPQGFALFFVSSAILFLSILLHELGHAWARKKYGAPYSEIVLHGFGGYCTGPGKFSRNQSIAISASGPAMNLVLAGLCFFLLEAFPTLPPIAKVAAVWGWRLNIALALLNLIPLYPLDGGQILAQLLGPQTLSHRPVDQHCTRHRHRSLRGVKFSDFPGHHIRNDGMGQLATASGTAKSISVISRKSRTQNSYEGVLISILPLP